MQYITNADDFGRTETANEAIDFGFNHGYLTRTTVMVNGEAYEKAKEIAKKHGYYDKIGLHINLTTLTPLTEDIKKYPLFCYKDWFNNGILSLKKHKYRLSKGCKKAVEQEIRAQIEKYIADGFTLMHADGHGHVHLVKPIDKIVIKLLKEYNFKSVRIARNVGLKGLKKIYKFLTNIKLKRFNKKNGIEMKYFDSYKPVKNRLNELDKEEGICEIMLHPNIYEDWGMQIGEGLHYPDLDVIKEKLL